MTTAAQTARAFRRLRWRLARNEIRAALTGSRLRLIMIAACSAIFWSVLFALFFEGFHFLGTFVKLSNEVVEYLFGIFFLSLMVMLVFSTGIILYQGLFRSRESSFLLTLPTSADRVFAYKFLEAMAFSSWGFLLLGSPMMVAYGITEGADWPFYALILLFLLAFVMIPGSLGGIGAILLANMLPRRRRRLLSAVGFASVAALVLLGTRLYYTPGDVMSPNWLDALLSRLAFSQHPLLPSRWMSRGLVGTARGDYRLGLFYLGVMASNAGLCYLIAAICARDLYRQGYSRTQGGRNARRYLASHRLDAVFHRVFFFIRRPIRLLILKDLRSFRRDPAQWSQFLIFFGLLAFYFVNIRRLGYHVQNAYFRNLLSLLNLAVTALILSTFTSRFIFPMLSLEGRNFWVLGLLPLSRAEILWGKFAFSVGISIVATEFLIILSDAMLQIGPAVIVLHMITVAVLCLGLSGISVGLGARMPNLKEDDPSKIAAGFGGTFNLLVSLVYIFLMLGTLAVPCHFLLASYQLTAGSFGQFQRPQIPFWLFAIPPLGLVLGTLGIFLPLRIGVRAFERMEL